MGTYASAYKSAYSPSNGIPRPAAKTYQEQEQNNAEDLWNSQYGDLSADQQRASTLRDSTQKQAADALTKFTSDTSTKVGAYKPTNTQLYQPTQLGQWLTSLSGNLNGPGQTAAVRTGGLGPIPAGSPGAAPTSELAKFDPSALTTFDPSAAGKEYAAGAYGDFKNNLSDELRTLENKSVAAGRLHTGMFDTDTGNVVTRLGSDYNNKIAQEAGVFSGQRLSALQGGTTLAYNRASDIDRNTETAAEARAAEAARTAEDSNSFALSSYADQTARYGLGLDAAGRADQMGYQLASDLDKYGYYAAKYQDDQAFQRGQTGLNAALNEEGRYNDEYNTASDRAGSYASATRDWAASDREAQDQRDLLNQLKAAAKAGPSWGGSPSGGGVVQPTPNQQLALRAGVPYYG